MPTISMTTFTDFINTYGTPRITFVRKAKRQYIDGYHPSKDYYKSLRDGIVRIHSNNQRRQELETIMQNIPESRRQNYRDCIASYRRWWGRRTIRWTEIDSAEWNHNELTVRVNPELGVDIDGIDYSVKLYFKTQELSRLRADVILCLMGLAMPQENTGKRVSLLDVRRNHLYTNDRDIQDIRALLRGEADAFASMWDNIEL